MSKQEKRTPRQKAKKIEPTPKEDPKPSKKSKDEYEPDPSRACDFKWTIDKSTPEKEIKEIKFCNAPADYRVKFYTDRKYLIQGGDGSKASDYQSLVEQEYLCEKHMDIKYKLSTAPTPKISFKRIKR